MKLSRLALLSVFALASAPSWAESVVTVYSIDVWGSDQFWAELVQPGRTSKPCVARGVVI